MDFLENNAISKLMQPQVQHIPTEITEQIILFRLPDNYRFS